jgi:peptidoglycan/LPS O-acetylase OafA/YrhL
MTLLVNHAVTQSRRKDHPTYNNFGALRLGFAVLVVYAHSFALAKNPTFEPLLRFSRGQTGLGMLAVNGFLVISGFLVTQSWYRSQSAGSFLLKRFRRIYPGYWTALAFSFAVGCAFAYPHAVDYLQSTITSAERLINALLLPDCLILNHATHVFASNPYPGVVNGSLWTLPVELFCYAVLLVAGLTGLLSLRAGLLVFFLCTFGLHGVLVWRWSSGIPPALQLTLYFLFGAVASQFWHRVPRPTLFRCSLVLILWAIAARVPPGLTLLDPLLSGYLVLAVAFAPGVVLASTLERFDLSYGVYLYSFPIQQAVVAATGTRNPFIVFGICIPIVFLLALASWKFIESPALGRVPKDSSASPVAKAMQSPTDPSLCPELHRRQIPA